MTADQLWKAKNLEADMAQTRTEINTWNWVDKDARIVAVTFENPDGNRKCFELEFDIDYIRNRNMGRLEARLADLQKQFDEL